MEHTLFPLFHLNSELLHILIVISPASLAVCDCVSVIDKWHIQQVISAKRIAVWFG